MGILQLSKNLGIQDNIMIRVVDGSSGRCLQSVQGHNAATSTLLTGIGHYLIGDGVLNQGSYMLGEYVPKYISLGTMGLPSQEESDVVGEEGLPKYLGLVDASQDTDPEHSTWSDDQKRFCWYLDHCPGFGADGNVIGHNNNRPALGLGPAWDSWNHAECELTSASFPRIPISFRQSMSPSTSELSGTIDVVFSAIISSGALKAMRPSGQDFLFISEVGMWTKNIYSPESNNGLLAAYRIVPTESSERDYSPDNYTKLKSKIIRVEKNQVVQVVWKLQLGSISDLNAAPGGGSEELRWIQL